MESDRPELVYQPVVRSSDFRTSHYECLVRMRQEDGSSIFPVSFLPVAEKTGIVKQIDRQVLKLAIDELRQHPNIHLAVNVSGLTTTDPSWLHTLVEGLEENPETANRLLVEITETAALQDIEGTTHFVDSLRELGCRVALDDFGAGYTSFRHLRAAGAMSWLMLKK